MSADYNRAKRAAEELAFKYYQEPPIDPEAIAEALGVEVVYGDFSEEMRDRISGYLEPEQNLIVVNSAIHPNRMTFTIAHELAHHILHRDYANSDKYRVFTRMNDYDTTKPDEEREADAFAASLLVPLPMLRKYKDIASVTELARMFCVSDAVILNRLKWVK